jgi:hypothetical protein
LNLELVNVILTSIVTFTKRAKEVKKAKDRATIKMLETAEKKRKTTIRLSAAGNKMDFDIKVPKAKVTDIEEEDPQEKFAHLKNHPSGSLV